jgi:hypothetical protein
MKPQLIRAISRSPSSLWHTTGATSRKDRVHRLERDSAVVGYAKESAQYDSRFGVRE